MHAKRERDKRETLKTKEETKNNLTRRFDLDPNETKRARRVIERIFDSLKLGTIYSPDIIDNKS